MNNDPTIILITDYGTGDPAFVEVTLQLKSRIPNSTVITQSTPAFSTLNTGFWIYQLALTKGLSNTYIYSNTAPRTEDKEAQANNKGEKLMYAKLKNGFEIIAVNAKFAFSFIKPYIESLNYVNVENEGSQFRSRDKFPQAVGKMVMKDSSFIGEAGDISKIPDYPKNMIASIDGYGNIKTTTRLSEVKFTSGQRVLIVLNGRRHVGYFTDGIFNIPQDNFSFAPGSSGHEDKFMEIFYRGGSASDLFGRVSVEEPFTITPA